jgi:NADH dehydrogenase (ubiquinone) 1 alpha subcomplex subunit 5
MNTCLTHARRPLKASTGITGLAVHPEPLPALKSTYTSTLSLLSSLPATSVYRQATEAITKHRLALVDGANGDSAAAETSLEAQVEVAIEEAKDEEKLVGKMIEWKA